LVYAGYNTVAIVGPFLLLKQSLTSKYLYLWRWPFDITCANLFVRSMWICH